MFMPKIKIHRSIFMFWESNNIIYLSLFYHFIIAYPFTSFLAFRLYKLIAYVRKYSFAGTTWEWFRGSLRKSFQFSHALFFFICKVRIVHHIMWDDGRNYLLYIVYFWLVFFVNFPERPLPKPCICGYHKIIRCRPKIHTKPVSRTDYVTNPFFQISTSGTASSKSPVSGHLPF